MRILIRQQHLLLMRQITQPLTKNCEVRKNWGGRAAIACGSVNNPVVHQMLVEIAERENIPYTVKVNPSYSGTDGDVIHMARGGVAVGVVSIPYRYMHSPNEMFQMSDVEEAAKLIAMFVRSMSAMTDFVPS